MRPSGRTSLTTRHANTLLKAAGQPKSVQDAIYTLVSALFEFSTVLPTNLDALRAKLDIIDIASENIPMSGELRRDRKGLRIVYSPHLPKDRMRFTIAHEMGHALLHKLGDRLPHSGPNVERVCDQVAAEMLMPRDAFLSRLSSGLTIERLFELRREFEVSLTAIARRCYELKGHSVFEVDNENVSWGTGIVRKGPVHLVETGVRLGIHEAYTTQNENVEVYFVDAGKIHRGELEYSRRSKGKMLFILRRDLVSDPTVTAIG